MQEIFYKISLDNIKKSRDEVRTFIASCSSGGGVVAEVVADAVVVHEPVSLHTSALLFHSVTDADEVLAVTVAAMAET